MRCPLREVKAIERLEVVVNSAVGLHARPAANLVQTAMAFKAHVFVEKEGRRANAKSMLSILSLGVHAGERVTFLSEGVDAAEALAAIDALAGNDFGEAVRKGV